MVPSEKKETTTSKVVLEALLSKLGLELTLTPGLELKIKENTIGKISQFTDPDILIAEVNLDKLLSQAITVKQYKPISKYPAVIEDLNFYIEKGQTYAQLIHKIKEVSSLIKKIELVDKYNTKLTLRLTYQSPTKQLAGKDIEPVREKLLTFSSQK